MVNEAGEGALEVEEGNWQGRLSSLATFVRLLIGRRCVTALTGNSWLLSHLVSELR